jgi:hypothetical protein
MSTTKDSSRGTPGIRTPRTTEDPPVRSARLTFEPDGETVTYDWYYEEIEPVLCGLCGKGCKKDSLAYMRCQTVAKYCG